MTLVARGLTWHSEFQLLDRRSGTREKASFARSTAPCPEDVWFLSDILELVFDVILMPQLIPRATRPRRLSREAHTHQVQGRRASPDEPDSHRKLVGSSSSPCRDPASNGIQAGLFFFLSPGRLLGGLFIPHILFVSLGFKPALRGNHLLGPMGRRPN